MKFFRAALPLTILSLALSACTPGGAGTDGPTPTPTPTAPAAAVAVVDAAKVSDGPPGTLKSGGVTATSLQLKAFPALAFAQENLRNRSLQKAAWADEQQVSVDTKVVAAAKRAIALMTTIAQGGATHHVTTVYDVASNKAYNGTALIEPGKWAGLVAAVAAADGGQPVADKLADKAYPDGDAPALGFTAQGDLVVVGDTVVTIPASTAQSMLTPLGIEVLGGATNPSRVHAPEAITESVQNFTGTPDATSTRPGIEIGPDCKAKKCVALTFDDGPVAETADLVELLRTKKVPATFFTLGVQVRQFPEIVTKTAALGNEVGWHTITHRSLPSLSKAKATSEIGTGNEALLPLTGSRPLVFRPPYGAHNKRIDAILADQKLANFIWSVDTLDWDKSKLQGDALTKAVIQRATGAKNGGIILMHDIHATSRAAVADVVDGLVAQGFTLVTVGELPGWQQYGWGKTYCAAASLGAACW